jgi:hypothetical protein
MKTIIALIALVSLTGCTHMKTESWTYTSFLSNKSLAELSVTKEGAVKVKRAESDQVQAISAIAEGVAKGLGKTVVPIP